MRTATAGSNRSATYFSDVLTRLVNLWPAARLDELMPWAWANAARAGASSNGT
jgi:hypothetical protein